MRIAHLIPYLGRAQGGPVFGLASCVKALADAGCDVEVFTVRRPADGEQVAIPPNVQVRVFDESGWGSFRRCPALGRALSQAGCEVVHSHGLWTDVHRSAAAQARKHGLPHLLAPCGMLMPGALRHHWWKKVPVRLWFQGRALREAQCLHAKSELEYEHIRRFGLRNSVAIIPNPVGGPVVSNQWPVISDQGAGVRGQKSVVCGPWSVVPPRRTVLFLGRLHPVKGVARLVEAWGEIQREKAESRKQKAEGRGQPSEVEGRLHGPRRTEVGGPWSRDPLSCNWQLVLAGPDEAGMRPGLEAALRARGCADSVIFTGQLDEAQKWAAYEAADLFVMPSDFENFGNSIVEAMLSGLPVVTTTGTPWKELPVKGAGWCVEPTVEAVRDALGAAMAMADGARQEMGRRAAALAARFSPEQAGADLVEVYQWLLGQGARPGCVV